MKHLETRTFPSLAFPSSFHHSNYDHRGLYRPIYVNTKKDLRISLKSFLFMDGLQSILDLALPRSKLQHHLVR